MSASTTDPKQLQQAEKNGAQAEAAPVPAYASPQERMDNIEKQLSVGRFASQQAVAFGLQIGGAVLGYFAGKGLGKAGIGKEIASGDGGSFNISSVIGAFVGLLVGGTAAGFRTWRKTEGERLAVKEINQDVATIMESRAKFEDTLNAQGEIVSEMRARVEALPVGEKTAALLDSRQAAVEAQRTR